MGVPPANQIGFPVLCRCVKTGHTSLSVTLDPQLRKALDLHVKDVLAFRVINVQGKRMAIVEKVAMGKIAVLSSLPADVLPTER
jgi:hypothetical protein